MTTTNAFRPRGSIPALVTPIGAGGEVDEAAFARIVEWQIASGSHALVVAGTTGESPALEPAEFESLLRIALERSAGRVPVIAGTGTAGTAKTIAASRRAAQLGADAVLVVTPYYNRPPQRGLIAHYRAVADAVQVPVVLYNVPGRTGVDLGPETALALNEHPNIVAVKEAVADMERVRFLANAGMTVISGDDPSALDAMRNGASGVISVAANVVPAAFSALCEAALEGRVEEAAREDDRLRPLYEFLGSESNPIPAKWILARSGRIPPGLRLPLAELAPELHARGDELIKQLEL